LLSANSFGGNVMPENDTYVNTRIEEGVAWLTLARPPVNVLHIPMLEQMESALAQLAADEEVRVLVLEARGKLFSAGVDVADHTADKVGTMIPLFDRVCVSLASFPVPTIAAVHGHALGGGCEIVLCCDLVVMAAGARLGQPEIQLAAIAPIAALRLPQLAGYRTAADMLFTGAALPAAEAYGLGLVNAVVESEDVPAWVQEKAGCIAALSRAALVLTKRALHSGFGDWSRALPDLERLYLEDLMATADAQEGLDAFLEKRRPAWQHR
jgi:cyclohexa-1,5-dienecarbonyl-CoA hydratase